MKSEDFKIHSLKAISPIDGRHRIMTNEMGEYFSEYALFKYRLFVEIEYLISLSELKEFTSVRTFKQEEKEFLRTLFREFSIEDAQIIQNIDRFGYKDKKPTNHDVKSVEYFLKMKIKESSLKDIVEMVHFGLTSEDVNNIAFNCMITECMKRLYLPTLTKMLDMLANLAKETKNLAMKSRTHGQDASPTTFGKEIANFIERIRIETEPIVSMRLPAKLNGAVGNWNAHLIASPEIDWINFTRDFISRLGFKPNLLTTQIEPHDGLARFFSSLVRINNIVRDLNTDMWLYISNDYLIQKPKEHEVGSSTMPHKINPWQFEVSEGSTVEANFKLNGFIMKLQTSRWQRDLSDHEAQRAIGVGIAHSYIAVLHTMDALSRIGVNKKVIESDLLDNPAILTEAIQTILRKEGVEKPYELMKSISRGKKLTLEELRNKIKELPVSTEIINKLLTLSPNNYVGYAETLTNMALDKWNKTREKLLPKITTILFDVDDTLIMGDLINMKARKEDLITQLELNPTEEERSKFMNLGIHSGSKYLAELATKQKGKTITFDNVWEIVKKRSGEFDHMLTLDPNAKEVLDYFKNKGFRLGVATDRGSSILRLLEKEGISNYFEKVVHMFMVQNKKPHPEPLIKLMGELNVNPENCVYVGNEEKDHMSAIAAGVIPMVLNKDYSIFSHVPSFYIKDLKETITIVENINNEQHDRT